MIWGNRHNPLGVAYHIYIMGVLQLVQYTYTYTEAIHSLTESDFEDELGSEEENKDDISEPEVVLTADVSIIFSRNNIMNFHFYVSLFLPFYIFILIDVDSQLQ
jgi:hypothetical protein